jgi:hypothetical protein
MRYFIQDNWAETLFVAAMCACGITFVVFVVREAGKEQAEWEVFRAEHSCRVVAKIPGEVLTGVGISASGSTVVTTTSTASRTGWLCDDGVTYYR